MTIRIITLTAIAAAALAGCATAPPPNASLDQARQSVQSARANPQVVALAPQELKRAEESLGTAEKTWSGGGSAADVDHQAYMTKQRVTLAQETASSLADQAITASAAAERDKTRLAVRTNEADTAKALLSQAERENARKASELAAADAQAQRDKAEVDRKAARVNDLEQQLVALNAKKTDRGTVVTLGDVLFDSGQSRLRPDASRHIKGLADAFKGDTRRTASIEGYTDSVGSEASNRELAGRRAGAVKDALVSLGVAADHLTTSSRGEDLPVASNDTAAGRQMNRRVEIVFPTVAQ